MSTKTKATKPSTKVKKRKTVKKITGNNQKHAYGFSYDPDHWAPGVPEPDTDINRNPIWISPALGRGEIWCGNGAYITGRLVAMSDEALSVVESAHKEDIYEISEMGQVVNNFLFLPILPVWSGLCDMVILPIVG